MKNLRLASYGCNRDTILPMASQNNLFVLFAASKPDAIKERLGSNLFSFVMLSQPITDDSWFLVAPAAVTTQEISDALGITDGSNGAGVVVKVENYYGRANPSLWEWINAKRGIELAQPQV